MLFSLTGLFGVMFVMAGIGFALFAIKFFALKDVVMISISELLFVFELFKHYDEIESPEQHLALISKMTPDEISRMHDQGNDLEIIKRVSTDVLERMKASVPGGHDIIANHRCTLMPTKCEIAPE